MTNAHTFNRNEFLNSSSHHFKMFPYRFLLYYFFSLSPYILRTHKIFVDAKKEENQKHTYFVYKEIV